MKVYPVASEETLRARKLLADWAGEGFLTKPQYQHLEHETVSGLRTTNFFLRLVLFLFTGISVSAAVALFFAIFHVRPSEQTAAIFLLMFAVVCYAVAEAVVFKAHLYRYGIEEALVVCSVGLLCTGMQIALFNVGQLPAAPEASQSLVLAAGLVFSLWIWRRFGLSYAFFAAMIFAYFQAAHWASSQAGQNVIVVVFYTIALLGIIAVRSRHHFDYADGSYSLIEAALWLGIYLAINLKLSPSALLAQGWVVGTQVDSGFARPFYWTTWVLIWCLPPYVLARGIRRKDRFVITVGALMAILTLVSNKPYLGWQRHSWDPMLLGIVLTAVALSLRRWLARGPGGIRHGFTAAPVSGKDKRWMNAGSVLAGLVPPQFITPGPQTNSPESPSGGGASGGAGAQGDF